MDRADLVGVAKAEKEPGGVAKAEKELGGVAKAVEGKAVAAALVGNRLATSASHDVEKCNP